MNTRWQCRPFLSLSVEMLHAAYKLRQDVFVIEQNCIYPDIDDWDIGAWHVLGTGGTQHSGNGHNGGDPLQAYCRLLAPGTKYQESAIGRFVTAPEQRGKGLGYALLERAVADSQRLWPNTGIRISAQAHLEKFYASAGFLKVSEPYDEDGIPHIEMLRAATF